MLRTHTCGELNKSSDKLEVTLAGWIDSIRLAGKIGFIDLRDRYGKTQIFLNKELTNTFKDLKKEDVIQVKGVVQARPESQVKEKGTGEIELVANEILILKKIPQLPLELDEKVHSTEETRLKYRYLDLRKPSMQKNIMLRHEIVQAMNEFMDKEGFLSIETPVLAKSTPEGARDYLVPARNFPGKFYALPQSPQIFKQLLMIAGFDKYFQVARCFRDEDLRADRQPDFTQLDVEMSFVEEKDVQDIIERLLHYIFKKVLKKELIIPFRRMTYKESIEKFKSDKPDLRKKKEEFSFLWITEFPMFEYNEEKKKFMAAHHPFTSPFKEDIQYLHKHKEKVRSRAYDLVLNGFELGSGSIRITDEQVQQEVFKAINLTEKEAKDRFGFFLDALQFAPPHGGIALGIDRLAAVMTGKTSIRDVIAFPKNKEARDLMTDAPSDVDKQQLQDLHLEVKK